MEQSKIQAAYQENFPNSSLLACGIASQGKWWKPHSLSHLKLD